jgi:serine/threonine protein kinase, bacterial
MGRQAIYDLSNMPLRRGATFAGFTIVRLLGSGGMGEVYVAEHPRLPRRDALKILLAEASVDTEYRARFNREADLLRYRYPAGMPTDQAVTIVGAMASALDYARQRGLLPRCQIRQYLTHGATAHRPLSGRTGGGCLTQYVH